MTECVFCSIVRGDLPAQIVLRSDTALAFLSSSRSAATATKLRGRHEKIRD